MTEHFAYSPTSALDVSQPPEIRRSTPRFDVEMRVRVIPEAPSGTFCFGQANDISEFGMALILPTGLETGTRVQIEFTLPITRYKLVIKGAIRNRNGYRYGVEFLFPSMEQRDAIVAACRILQAIQR